MNLTCLRRSARRMGALAVLLACAVSLAAAAAPEAVVKKAAPVSVAKKGVPRNGASSHSKRRDSPPAYARSAMGTPSIYRVPLGESRVFRFRRPIKRVAVGDPKVADYIMMSSSEMYLLGKKLGSTNLVVWDRNGNVTTSPVQVSRGTAALQAFLKVIFPEEYDIHIEALGPALVLSGSVSDAMVAESVVRLTTAYFGGSISKDTPESALIGSDSKPFTGIISENNNVTFSTSTETHTEKTIIMGGGGASAAGSAGADSTRGVVNLLKIRNSQQVRLEVCIAQVSKTFLESLGVSFLKSSGDAQGASLLTGFVSNATLNNFLIGRLGQSNGVKVVADRKPSLFKVLAEPTIVTMSGKEGYFLVGGKIFVPVAITYSVNGLPMVTSEEQIYGVGLRFTPVVLDAGRISLKVVSEVSEPDTESVTAGTTSNLPTFKISTVSTSVQMSEGENLVIGGLKLDNLTNSIDSVPLLGEIPILGALFRDTKKDSEKNELMVIVRPSLVKASTTRPELPTDKFVPPTRGELFFGGKLEGAKKK